ncbi:unnamed protein product [Euphydryas editha]|uniref:Metalloendopeptidase n=1 Tax=Euphydryas editha TaxID=104508 RepID=A0AAU9U3C7_EUPED|nr:unnamed protein product [Euphydryas editha]
MYCSKFKCSKNKLIKRKRQDTLEICRIFNEENKRSLNANDAYSIKVKKHNIRHRIKRNVDNNELGNSILKQDDLVRVEKIVDKLYDDMDSTGNTVVYRRRVLTDVAKEKNLTQNINRRFNFAPALLQGPLTKIEQKKALSQPYLIKIPWIKKWKHGIVPFFIDSKTYDSFLVEIILKAFDYIEKTTCIRLQRLRERPTDQKSMQNVEWLYITNPSGIRQCVHTNERKPNTGVQMVVFGYDCLSQGEIAHEIMHILGFSHEHTRPDRDRYITILWENIKPGYKKYFEVRKEDYLSNLPYDYASVLHYPPRAFSKNGQVTLVTELGTKIGQREAFSELDVEKIRMIYGKECVERNLNYLVLTCNSASQADYNETQPVTKEEIKHYFKDRIWPYGIVNFKIKDAMEFTAEEKENIKAVINHIEKETCIEFSDINAEDKDDDDIDDEVNSNINEIPKIKKLKFEIEDGPLPGVNSENGNITLSEDDAISESENIGVENENITAFFDDTLSKSSELKFATLSPEFPSMSKENGDDLDTKILRHGKAKINKTLVRSKLKQNKSKGEGLREKIKKVRIPLPSSSRRHAANVIVLKRSTEPGCKCPPPGKPNGNKILTINTDCFNSVNDLLHLFVHVLGLDHQHNMYDRDKYLYIRWNDMSPEIQKEMQKTLPAAATAGFSYDYQSVMHYPWMQIKDGATNTMYPIWNDGWTMGNWQGLSWTDVQKIERIYKDQCEKRRRENNSNSYNKN